MAEAAYPVAAGDSRYRAVRVLRGEQWPTIPTLIMVPILVLVYARLARSEEREVTRRFGAGWAAYAARTPAFLPRLRFHRRETSGRNSAEMSISDTPTVPAPRRRTPTGKAGTDR